MEYTSHAVDGSLRKPLWNSSRSSICESGDFDTTLKSPAHLHGREHASVKSTPSFRGQDFEDLGLVGLLRCGPRPARVRVGS